MSRKYKIFVSQKQNKKMVVEFQENKFQTLLKVIEH